MIGLNNLKNLLSRIDGKGYKAYKDLRGVYQFPSFQLYIDYVQGDPFASPSKIRVKTPTSTVNLNDHHTHNKHRKIRCEDFIARKVSNSIRANDMNIKGSGKSGLLTIDQPGQEVIERTAVQICDQFVTVCLSVGLPAQGRRVLGKQAERLLTEALMTIMEDSIFSLELADLEADLRLCDQQQTIRQYLNDQQLIAFIANGATLPRESGVSNKPLRKNNTVKFQSPKEMEVEITLPHQDEPLKGMGIRKGISLIVGGGYHGKSTLLHAIERGVYDHIKGDGREYVITDQCAFKIRAEDGRGVSKVNISPFIKNLPHGKNTEQFSSENASGSTSQAANIIEALEAGSTTLLIDEDTSATNFMIRDSRMQKLVAKEKEPITPFIDKVKQLFDEHGVSTILVVGGSGDYFDVADRVIMMDQYTPFDATKRAKEIAKEYMSLREQEDEEQFGSIYSRTPLPNSLYSKKGNKHKVKTRGKTLIQYGQADIQLQFVEQLVSESQTRMIAEVLLYLERENLLKNRTVAELLQLIEKKLDQEGLDSFGFNKGKHPGELAKPRTLEIAAALNRLRTLSIK